MLNIKGLVAGLAIASSIFLAVGCSSNQAAEQNGVQQGYGQSSQQVQSTTQTQASYQSLDAAQAKQLIDSDKTLQIIDVREQDEWDTGHIPGAKLIPLSQFAARMGEIDKTRPVFLYCAVGSRSAEAAQVLVQSGYSKVYALANGLAEWPYEIVK